MKMHKDIVESAKLYDSMIHSEDTYSKSSKKVRIGAIELSNIFA